MTDPRFQEALNKNMSLFVGISRAEYLFEIIKNEGPIPATELYARFSKSTLEKTIRCLQDARLISSQSVGNPNGIMTRVWKVRE